MDPQQMNEWILFWSKKGLSLKIAGCKNDVKVFSGQWKNAMANFFFCMPASLMSNY